EPVCLTLSPDSVDLIFFTLSTFDRYLAAYYASAFAAPATSPHSARRPPTISGAAATPHFPARCILILPPAFSAAALPVPNCRDAPTASPSSCGADQSDTRAKIGRAPCRERGNVMVGV